VLAVAQTPAPPHIDGVIEAQWGDAPVADGFWISEYRQAPAERTEVRVLADQIALYFLIVCYDSRPNEIRADQTQRDQSMGVDDRVTIELDPYHNHRLISKFSVNARGTQADELAGGRARKIDWKGEWQAAARRSSEGWTAEIAIPFGILEYQPAATVFGVNFVRYHARTQEFSRWADVTPQYLAEETGHLVQLQLPGVPAVTRFAVMPYASGGWNTISRDGQPRDLSGTAGTDVRLDLARNSTSVVTVNPDFSQVEATVLDLAFNYNEKYRADPRPFFQEGAGFFGSRSYFYSTRISDFLVGAKAFGRFGGYQVGALTTYGEVDGRRDFAGSVRREIGPTLNVGVTAVATDQTQFSNQLVGAQSNGLIGGRLAYGVDVSASSTTGRPGDGLRAAVSVGYRGPYLQVELSGDRTDASYFPANGLIASDLLDTRGARSELSLGRGFGNGWIRRLDASASLTARDTSDGLLQRQEWSLYASGDTRSNVQVSGGLTIGPYRPRDGSTGWQDVLYDDRFYTVTVAQYSPDGRYGSGLSYSWGNLSAARYSDVAPYIWVKPSATTSISYSYERADYLGASEQHILSASWDVSRQDSVSGRWVRSGEPFYRVAYRRVVRRGLDVFAVFNDEPDLERQLIAKVVWTLNLVPTSRADTAHRVAHRSPPSPPSSHLRSLSTR
jgi:hypothetical protein